MNLYKAISDSLKKYVVICPSSNETLIHLEMRNSSVLGNKEIVIHCPIDYRQEDIDRYLEEHSEQIIQEGNLTLLKVIFECRSQQSYSSNTDDVEYSLIGNVEGYPVWFKPLHLNQWRLTAEIVKTKDGELIIQVEGFADSFNTVIEYVKENLDELISKDLSRVRRVNYFRRQNSTYIAKEGFSYANPRNDIEDTEWQKQVKHKQKSSTIEPTRTSASFYVGTLAPVQKGNLVISSKDGRGMPFNMNEEDSEDDNKVNISSQMGKGEQYYKDLLSKRVEECRRAIAQRE